MYYFFKKVLIFKGDYFYYSYLFIYLFSHNFEKKKVLLKKM